MTEIQVRLLDWARQEAERHFDPRTLTCIIPRETAWYAITLLESAQQSDRQLADRILTNLRVNDGTHSPCTLYVIYQRYRDRLSEQARTNILTNLADNLAISAGVRYSDGNVNHPVAAWVHLICGGELLNQPVYQNLGKRNLQEFQQVISGRRHQRHQQAEMAEYNSPTYSALTLWFLAIAAEFAADRQARDTALTLEQGLWINCAMHWHEPSQQFAGPFSRAYAEDSMGGFSALHCTMACAMNRPLFMEPALARRFEHPSALIQNSFPAILNFHVPAQAFKIMFEKPLPYYFRMTTYCEQYHENGIRQAKEKPVACFDDEVYPGGWGDLSTFLCEEYCLATAGRPYVNAGQSDSFTLRYRKALAVKKLDDFRSLYTRMAFNSSVVGRDNFCHVTGTKIGRDYLYEEGRVFTCQHENRAIVCYSPKRAGHQHILSLSLELIFSYHSDFDELYIDDEPVRRFPFESRLFDKIVIGDFRTRLAIYPLSITLVNGFQGLLRVRIENDHLLLSIYNYQGEALTIAREQMSHIKNGFACLVETKDRFKTMHDFLDYLQDVKVEETDDPTGTRHILFHCGPDQLAFSINPVDERIVRRQWNGKDEPVHHLEVQADGDQLFRPQNFYGNGNSI